LFPESGFIGIAASKVDYSEIMAQTIPAVLVDWFCIDMNDKYIEQIL
jgi:hypothetical protein